MNKVIGTMRKSLHIIKGCFYKIATIIINTDDRLCIQTLEKFLVVLEMNSVMLSETKIQILP